MPHLVHDLAGLGHRVRSGLGRLGRGEGRERGRGELGTVGKGEERGEQGVPAQQGQEPGGARSRHAKVLAVRARRRDLECGQVGEAACAGRRQLGPAGREGHTLHELTFQSAELGLCGGRGRRDLRGAGGSVGVGRHPKRQLRRAVRLEVQGPYEAAGARARLLDGVRGGVVRTVVRERQSPRW